jgi:asparagine synthase (glutamine-hydrolysing)
VEKAIFRRALQGLLPRPILNRRKTPYPKTHNPSYMAMAKQRFQAILEDHVSPLVPLIDQGHVQALLASEDTIHYPWFGQLMTKAHLFVYLIQCDTWRREYRATLV